MGNIRIICWWWKEENWIHVFQLWIWENYVAFLSLGHESRLLSLVFSFLLLFSQEAANCLFSSVTETTAELLHLERQRTGTMKSSAFLRGCRVALKLGEISSGFTNVGDKVVVTSSRKEKGIKTRTAFLRDFPLSVFFRLWFENRKCRALDLSLDEEMICLGPNFVYSPLGSIEDRRMQIHKYHSNSFFQGYKDLLLAFHEEC